MANVANLANLALNALLRGMMRAWALAASLVLALSLLRLGQMAWFWPPGYHASWSDLAAVLVQGLRFDLKVAAVVGFLLLLVLPWVSKRVNTWLGTAVAWVFVMASLVNLHYFGFYKTPIDAMIFGLRDDDTAAVLRTIWRDFPVLPTLALGLALTLAAVGTQRWLLQRLTNSAALDKRTWALRLTLLALAFFALLLAGKGTLRAMALQRQHLTVTTSQFLNDMVPNGVIALNYAWDEHHEAQNLADPLLGLKAMGFASPLAAGAALGLPSKDPAALKVALTSHPPVKSKSKKNLIFFLMESWSAEPLLYQSPSFDVMGQLAGVMSQACHFSNFDSAQNGTHPALEAILFSSPITPLTLSSAGRQPMPWAIPRVLRQAGYHTLFVTSGRAGWRDINRAFKAQGFDEIVDASQLKALYPEAELGIWGVWDSFIYRYLNQRLAAQPSNKPLFVFVLTSTNHPPYDLPANYQPVALDMTQWRGETSAPTLLPNLHSYRYATDLLGGFVQQFQRTAQYQNSIVAATGDHNVRSFGVYASASRRYLLHQVPFVIWGQNLACGTQQLLPASHRDMFSTLLPLIGVTGPYLNAGRDLLRATGAASDALNAPRALLFTGEARNAKGIWKLGNAASFSCSPAQPSAGNCQFNANDDLQERARLGLLDWYIRSALGSAAAH